MGTYVRVDVGNETYAFPIENIKEVANLGALTPVPGAPHSLLGVYSLRGEILSVYELSELLGHGRSTARATERTKLLVVEHGPRLIGLAVDTVDDVVDLPEPTESTQSPLLRAAAIVGFQLVGFIDVEVLFSTLEMQVKA